MKTALAALLIFCFGTLANAQVRGMPKLPTSGSMGLQGSAGTGFADFQVGNPSADLKIDRGVFVAGAIERGFDILNLYLTLTMSYMTAEGNSNYSFTDLSASTTYTATNLKFSSNVTDLGLGLKFKIIDGYWFRPYVEGGLLGGYHQISYQNAQTSLASQGNTYKTSDVAMGYGTYGEGGVEAMFSDKFGVKLAGRFSNYQTKDMETFGKRPLKFTTETYYFSLLFGM